MEPEIDIRPEIIITKKDFKKAVKLMKEHYHSEDKSQSPMLSVNHRIKDSFINCEVENFLNKNVHSFEAENPHPHPNSMPNERKCWERFLGIGLMTLASLCFSLSVTAVKGISPGYPIFSVTMWTLFGGCFLLSIPILVYLQLFQKSAPFATIFPLCERDKLKTFSVLLLRTLLGSAAMVCQYSALNYLSMSDTTVICFSTPVFVTFLACIVLGEMFGVINILAVLITLCGVVIITRPPFLTEQTEMDANIMIGVGYALGAMTLSSVVFITLRLLKPVNFFLVTFSFGFVGSVVCLVLSQIFGTFEMPHSAKDLILAFLSSVFTFAAQVAMTAAFKFEDAGPLSLIRSFDVIFSFVWQAIFFQEEPDKYSILGALVVMSGVILIGFRKHVSSLPPKHPCRKMCCFILK